MLRIRSASGRSLSSCSATIRGSHTTNKPETRSIARITFTGPNSSTALVRSVRRPKATLVSLALGHLPILSPHHEIVMANANNWVGSLSGFWISLARKEAPRATLVLAIKPMCSGPHWLWEVSRLNSASKLFDTADVGVTDIPNCLISLSCRCTSLIFHFSCSRTASRVSWSRRRVDSASSRLIRSVCSITEL